MTSKQLISSNFFSVGNFIKAIVYSIVLLSTHHNIVLYSFILLNLIMQSHKTYININHKFKSTITIQSFSQVIELSKGIHKKSLEEIVSHAKILAPKSWKTLLYLFHNWNIMANHNLDKAHKSINFKTISDTSDECLAYSILFPGRIVPLIGGTKNDFEQIVEILKSYSTTQLQIQREKMNTSTTMLLINNDPHHESFYKIGSPYMLYMDLTIHKNELYTFNFQLGNQYRLCLKQKNNFLFLRAVLAYWIISILPAYSLLSALLVIPLSSSESLFLSAGFNPQSSRSLQRHVNIFNSVNLSIYSVGHILLNVLVNLAILIYLPAFFGQPIHLNIDNYWLICGMVILAIDRFMLYFGIRAWIPFIGLSANANLKLIQHKQGPQCEENVKEFGKYTSLNGLSIPSGLIAPFYSATYHLLKQPWPKLTLSLPKTTYEQVNIF